MTFKVALNLGDYKRGLQCDLLEFGGSHVDQATARFSVFSELEMVPYLKKNPLLRSQRMYWMISSKAFAQ